MSTTQGHRLTDWIPTAGCDCGKCAAAREPAVQRPLAETSEAERTVASLACMLGWDNIPPRDVLERSVAALKARAARASVSRVEPAPQREPGPFGTTIGLQDPNLAMLADRLNASVTAALAALQTQYQQALERLTRQAQDISVTLGEAGCRAMPIVDGVRWLVDHNLRQRALVAERDETIRQQAEQIAELEGEAKDRKYHPTRGLYAIEADRDRLLAEFTTLRADHQDWRKGVELIASALGDKDDNLSCVRIAEVALTLRAEQETLRAALERADRRLSGVIAGDGIGLAYEAQDILRAALASPQEAR